jgi:hypothetical protein
LIPLFYAEVPWGSGFINHAAAYSHRSVVAWSRWHTRAGGSGCHCRSNACLLYPSCASLPELDGLIFGTLFSRNRLLQSRLLSGSGNVAQGATQAAVSG